jgi:hypothetical protein
MLTNIVKDTTALVSDAPSRVGRARRRVAAVLVTVAFLVAAGSSPAYAVDPTTAPQVFTDAAGDLVLILLAVAGAIIVPAVTILGVKKGWPMFKRFF